MKEKKENKAWNWFKGLKFWKKAVLVLVAFGMISAVFSPSEEAPKDAEPKKEDVKKEEPKKEEVKKEEVPKSPVDSYKASLSKSLQAQIKGVEVANGTAMITFKIGDNLTQNMIHSGILIDMKDIMKALKGSSIEYTNVNIIGVADMVDVNGNESKDMKVLNSTISKDKLSNINFDKFLTDNVPKVMDTFSLHKAFQPKAK